MAVRTTVPDEMVTAAVTGAAGTGGALVEDMAARGVLAAAVAKDTIPSIRRLMSPTIPPGEPSRA
jgi:hypothetical protein